MSEKGERNRPFVSIHPLSLLPLLLLFYFNEPPVLLVMLLCTLMHESGHLAVALLQGRRILGLSVHPGGLELCVQSEPFSYGADLCLHLGGPLFNFLGAVISVLFIRLWPSELRFFAFYTHVLLGIFHLLPIWGLDGGHALYAFLCRIRDPQIAYFVCRRVSLVTLSALCLLLLIGSVQSGFHLSLCVCACTLPFFWGHVGGRKGGRIKNRSRV